jgi:hypothetical protein
MMEAASTSETLVDLYATTRRYIQEADIFKTLFTFAVAVY